MFYACAVIVIILNCVYSENVNRSLAFVVDTTDSMKDDIDLVKDYAGALFDNITQSKGSMVRDFILTTFQDPGVDTFTSTSKEDFLSHINHMSIKDMGDDCPENSLEGIIHALNASRSNSIFFVFTDASAKDYENTETVVSMAMDKSCRIIFILTSCNSNSFECTCPLDEDELDAYHEVAEATFGLVLNVQKRDVGEMLEFVSESTRELYDPILVAKQPPGAHNLTVPTDSYIKTMEIIATSKGDVSLSVSLPNGTLVHGSKIGTSGKNKKASLPYPGQGNVTVISASLTEHVIHVTGVSVFRFRHGFSLVPADNLDHTTARPISGAQSYLLLDITDGKKTIEIKSVAIVATDDDENDYVKEILMEINIAPVKDSDNLYTTTERFNFPEKYFKIVVKGIDKNTGDTLERPSLPLSSIDESELATLETHPKTSIDGDRVVFAKFKESKELLCQVVAFPDAKMSWIDVESKEELPSTEVTPNKEDALTKTLSLRIEKVMHNATYRCVGKNRNGEHSSDVTVQIKPYINVIMVPDKNYSVKYNQSFTLSCKVDAYPKAYVTWWLFDKQLTGGPNVNISDNGTKLQIKHINEYTAGAYACEVTNGLEHKRFVSSVSLNTDFKPSVEIQGLTAISVPYNGSVDLKCVIKAHPKPQVAWIELARAAVLVSTMTRRRRHSYSYTNQATVSRIVEDHNYTCKASNLEGTASETIIVRVRLDLPSIEQQKSEVLEVVEGETVTVDCTVAGYPTPVVNWTIDGNELDIKDIYVNSHNGLSFQSSFSQHHNKSFVCSAKNDLGETSRSVQLFVKQKPIITNLPAKTFKGVVGDYVLNVPCQATGYPAPSLVWRLHHNTIVAGKEYDIIGGTLVIRNNNRYIKRVFTCEACNTVGCTKQWALVKITESPDDPPPSSIRTVAVKRGKSTDIPCKHPPDTALKTDRVLWFSNKMFIATGQLKIINASKAHIGFYVCRVSNQTGSETLGVRVILETPPTFINPSKTTVEALHGTKVTLDCSTNSDVKVKWEFKGKEIILEDEINSFSMQNQNEGVYRCIVSNKYGRVSRRFQVILLVKPKITEEEDRNFEAVLGDKFLEIPCHASGKPKPVIHWFEGRRHLKPDGSSIEITRNNSLKLLNLTENNDIKYVCEASNRAGKAKANVFVTVSRYCTPTRSSEAILIRERDSKTIPCDVTHNAHETPRWYKNYELYTDTTTADGKLILRGKTDFIGAYVCRALNGTQYQTGDGIILVLKIPPKFVNLEYEDQLTVSDKYYATPDCIASGYPPPKVSWKLNGEEIETSDNDDNEFFEPGFYECDVYNEYGSIHREFLLETYLRSCQIDPQILLSADINTPLFFNNDYQKAKTMVQDLDTLNGTIRLRHNQTLNLVCPSRFVNPSGAQFKSLTCTDGIIKVCSHGSRIKCMKVNLSRFLTKINFNCVDKVKPTIMPAKDHCWSGHRRYDVGFKIPGSETFPNFNKIYEICFDTINNVTLYTRQEGVSNTRMMSITGQWFGIEPAPSPSVLESLEEWQQLRVIRVKHGLKCLFRVLHLVGQRDVPLGAATAVFNHQNVAPLWSSCNTKNWEEVERRVRQLSRGDPGLLVWTGASGVRGHQKYYASSSFDIILEDSRNSSMTVPRYIWKVVNARNAGFSLAIIHVNINYGNLKEAKFHALCPDVCFRSPMMSEQFNGKVDWYHDVDNGYIFCCEVEDFEEEFFNNSSQSKKRLFE